MAAHYLLNMCARNSSRYMGNVTMSPRAKYVPLRLKHLPFSNLISWQWRGVQAVDGDGLTQDIVSPNINLWLDLCLSSEDFHFPPACLQYGGVKPCSRPSLITNSGRAAEKNMVFIMSGLNRTVGVHQSSARQTISRTQQHLKVCRPLFVSLALSQHCFFLFRSRSSRSRGTPFSK